MFNLSNDKNFKNKYYKYKIKYLNLKENIKNMKGGNKPSPSILKNINLLQGNQKFLDPTIGYVWSLNAAKNYYLFGDDDSFITKLVKKLYLDANIDGLFPKTQTESQIKPYQIGYLLGKWFNYIFNVRQIRKIIEKYVKDTSPHY